MDWPAKLSVAADSSFTAQWQDVLRQTLKFLRPGERVRGTKGGRSLMDGVDWVELGAYAEENKMPFETVADLLSVLKSKADR
jgi:hypothetical protein